MPASGRSLRSERFKKRRPLLSTDWYLLSTHLISRLTDDLQLKPQAGKSRGAAPKPETLANLEKQNGDTPFDEEEEEVERANPLYTRYISDARSVRLGVPEEWKGKHVGQVLYAPAYSGPKLPPPNGRMIQELD